MALMEKVGNIEYKTTWSERQHMSATKSMEKVGTKHIYYIPKPIFKHTPLVTQIHST